MGGGSRRDGVSGMGGGSRRDGEESAIVAVFCQSGAAGGRSVLIVVVAQQLQFDEGSPCGDEVREGVGVFENCLAKTARYREV